MGFWVITESGRTYLDRMLFANYKIGDESERKQRILSFIEHKERATDQEILAMVKRQRDYGVEGWAPRGSKQEYLKTLVQLQRQGLIRRD